MTKYRIVKRKHYSEQLDKFFDWYDLEQEAIDHRFIQGLIMKKTRWYNIVSEKSISEVKNYIERKTKQLQARAVEEEREVIETFELDVDLLTEDRRRTRRYVY